jgi:hypothetical protein
VKCLSFRVGSDSVFNIASDLLAIRTLSFDVMIRAHVVSHRCGFLCEGPLDDIELDPSVIKIDQVVHGELVQTPILLSTVRGTCAALTASQAELPSFTAWSSTFPIQMVHFKWRYVWSWVHVSHRDGKVSDFLWRLMHRSLRLGIDRRHYSRQYGESICCAVCPTETETYAHFLFECPTSSDLWRWFCDTWRSCVGVRLGHDLFSCLFCSIRPSNYRSKAAKARWLVLSLAHGELLYSLWLCRCRAIFDEDASQLHLANVKAIAKFRMCRSLDTLAYARKYSDPSLQPIVDRFKEVIH